MDRGRVRQPDHPVGCAATPPLHKEVRVSRSAWMRESDLEIEEGRKNSVLPSFVQGGVDAKRTGWLLLPYLKILLVLSMISLALSFRRSCVVLNGLA